MQPTARIALRGRRFEQLEPRLVLTGPTSLTIPLDATLDQFGDQVMTVQAYGDASRATFGIFDTGASAVTFSPDDQTLFQFLNAGIPIKVAGGAQASGIGGDITGDVSQPGTILADGLHASGLSFDAQGFPVFSFSLGGGAAADNVQALVGTDPGSPNLPTITGTPILNPSQAHPGGEAARIDFQGETLDFSDLIPGLTLSVPDLHFVDPGSHLTAVTGVTTDPVTVPLTLFGDDNHLAPGDSITNSPSPMQPDVQLVWQGATVGRQHFLLDTGSQLTVISTAAAHVLGLDQQTPTTTIDVQGVGGTESVPGYTLDELDLPTSDGGEIHFTGVPVYVLDIAPGVDGLLGTNLWDTAASMLYDPFNPAGSPTLELTFQTNPDRNQQLTSSQISQLGGGSAALFANAFGGAGVAVHQLPGFALPASETLTGSAAAVAAVAGSAFSGAAAAFTDSNAAAKAADFSATIDWGDGSTSAGAVVAAGAGFSVQGTHVYAAAGTFEFKVSVAGKSASAAFSGSATVAAAQTPHERYVRAVYLDVLNRAPDADGLAYWAGKLDGGAPAGDVAASIAHSDEYYANFVIKPDYLKYLGRAADPSGVTFWTQKMHGGLSDERLEADLIASDEFYAQAGGADAKWIDAVYQGLLGRAADDAGRKFWTDALSAGESRDQVAFDFTSSGERERARINDDYYRYLGRAADSDGLAFWLGAFAAGKTNEDLISGFTGSQEYYKQHAG